MLKHPRWIRPLWVLLFGLCPLIFFTDLTRNPFHTQITLLNILVVLCWLVWLWQAWRERVFIWVGSPLDGLLFLLTGICLLSWVVSFFKHPLFWRPIYSEGSRAIIFWLVNVLLVYAAAIRYQDRSCFRKTLWICYAVSLIASVYGIAQYFGTEWIWPQALNPYGNRPVSTFGNPNFMSSYLVMIFAVAAMDYLLKITGVPRSLLFVVVLSSACAMIATLTRSSWLGAVAACFILAFFFFRASSETRVAVQKPAMALGLALLVVVTAWPKSSGSSGSTVLSRLEEVEGLSKGSYGAVSQRFLIWMSAWKMVEDHPLLGQGWGCFELFFPYKQGPLLIHKAFRGLRTHANNAHNEILEYASQIGLAGLGVIILIWVVFFRMSGSAAARLPLPWRGMEWGLVAGVAGMLVDNLLNVSAHFAVPALLLWWFVASAIGMDPAILKTRRIEIRGPWRRAALALAAAALAVSIGRSACLWAEEVNFYSGFKLTKSNGDPLLAEKYLERAYAFHHLEVNNNYELANLYAARLGDKARALDMYRRALDANAGYDEIYFNRAATLAQLGRSVEAVADYQTALGINPLLRNAYNALGALYMQDLQHHGDEAAALFQKGVEFFPDDKDLWNNLGYVEAQRGRWEQASQAYRKALEIDPKFETARRNLAFVNSKLPRAPQTP